MQINRLLELRRSVRKAGEADPLSAFAEHPSYRYLASTVEDYVQEVEDLFVPQRVETGGEPPADAVEHAHRRMLTYMLYA